MQSVTSGPHGHAGILDFSTQLDTKDTPPPLMTCMNKTQLQSTQHRVEAVWMNVAREGERYRGGEGVAACPGRLGRAVGAAGGSAACGPSSLPPRVHPIPPAEGGGGPGALTPATLGPRNQGAPFRHL